MAQGWDAVGTGAIFSTDRKADVLAHSRLCGEPTSMLPALFLMALLPGGSVVMAKRQEGELGSVMLQDGTL